MSDDHQEASFQRRDPSTFAPILVSVAHVIPVGMSALMVCFTGVYGLLFAVPMTGLSVWAIHAVMAGRPLGRTLTIHTPFLLLVAGASLLVMSRHVSKDVYSFLGGLGEFYIGLSILGYAVAFTIPALISPLAPRVSALYHFLRELRFAEEEDEEEAPLPASRRAIQPTPPRPPLSRPWQLAIAAMAMPFGIFAVMSLVNRSYYDPMELIGYSCVGVPAIMLLLLRHPAGRTLALAAPISFWIVSLLALLAWKENSFIPLAYWVNYALPTTLGLALLRAAVMACGR